MLDDLSQHINPCPFCKKSTTLKVVIVDGEYPDDRGGFGSYKCWTAVECGNCLARGPKCGRYKSLTEATNRETIKAWNACG